MAYSIFVKFWTIIQFSVMYNKRVVIKLILNPLIQFDRFFLDFYVAFIMLPLLC